MSWVPPSVGCPHLYTRGWSAFRERCDERGVILGLLESCGWLQRICEMRGEAYRLVDLGCGDGRITAFVLRELRRRGATMPAELHLVDPLAMAEDAKRRCGAIMGARSVSLARTTAGQFLRRQPVSAPPTFFLAAHSAYYFSGDELERLGSCESNAAAAVVINDLESLFADCWRWSSPAAWRQLRRVHEWLSPRAEGRATATACLRGNREVLIGSSPAARTIATFIARQGQIADPRRQRRLRETFMRHWSAKIGGYAVALLACVLRGAGAREAAADADAGAAPSDSAAPLARAPL